MDYNAHMVARAEHERMVRSLPAVPEYGYNVAEPKSSNRPLMVLRLILTTILHLVTK
jgi:hypothetical protein